MDLAAILHRQTRQALEAAGWHPGRAVNTSSWQAELAADGFPALHPAAHEFITEFGGLAVPYGGTGITRAREPFTLAPTDCLGEADRFIAWSEHIGHSIAPIGELAGGTCGYALLGIDEQARVYVVIDKLATFGPMPHAMDHLVLGSMPRDIN